MLLENIKQKKFFKVVKILQELAESDPKVIPIIKGKDGQIYLNKQQNYRWYAELAALSKTGSNSVTFAELNELDTQRS